VQAERGFAGTKNATKLTPSEISSVVLGGSPLQRAEGLPLSNSNGQTRAAHKAARPSGFLA